MGKSYLADIPGNRFVAYLGQSAAIASNGADARLENAFVCPADLKLIAVQKVVLANEVTKGTGTTSASYRRFLLYNGGPSGAGTASASILASLNATASAALGTTRNFTLAATPTAAQGDILYLSQLTVGAATGDGTDAAACSYQAIYELI